MAIAKHYTASRLGCKTHAQHWLTSGVEGVNGTFLSPTIRLSGCSLLAGLIPI
jgi:hypothetical protein